MAFRSSNEIPLCGMRTSKRGEKRIETESKPVGRCFRNSENSVKFQESGMDEEEGWFEADLNVHDEKCCGDHEAQV